MQDLLGDLVTAHKSLCAAVEKSMGSSEPVFGQSSRQPTPPSHPQPTATTQPASSAYLTDQEEAEFAEQLGLRQQDPLMDELVKQDFARMLSQRQALQGAADAIKPLTRESGPRTIIPPGYQGIGLSGLSGAAQAAPPVAEAPRPVPADEIPPEIAFMDHLTEGKMRAPDRLPPRPSQDLGRGMMSDFESFLQQG